MKVPVPKPIFDTLKNIDTTPLPAKLSALAWVQKDDGLARDFLKQYNGSESTFRAYRREMERLLQWSWLIAKKSVLALKREDIEKYIEFCINPPKTWVGTKNVARFINKNSLRIPNPEWRMFVVSVSKADFKKGERALTENYQASEKTIREIFVVTGSFYSTLVNEGITDINPVLLIRQKSKYYTRKQGGQKVDRLLTERQWQYCIEVAEAMANRNTTEHERTLFIMSILYLLYLRVSELTVSDRWKPEMGHFYQNSEGSWFFKVLGKGNKLRTISVSDGLLVALKRYRTSLNLTPLPVPGEQYPLISKLRGKGGITSDREIRNIVQSCFDQAVQRLRDKGHENDANSLETATVHWLRHTGISDDLNKRGRPMVHVRDDAGHENSLTTDRYNNSDIQERYLSAKDKQVYLKEKK